MLRPHKANPGKAGKSSPAQAAARERNFRIFKLRGLHAQMRMLTGEHLTEARACVDLELIALGAKTMAEAEADRRAKLYAKLDARIGPPTFEEAAPF